MLALTLAGAALAAGGRLATPLLTSTPIPGAIVSIIMLLGAPVHWAGAGLRYRLFIECPETNGLDHEAEQAERVVAAHGWRREMGLCWPHGSAPVPQTVSL